MVTCDIAISKNRQGTEGFLSDKHMQHLLILTFDMGTSPSRAPMMGEFYSLFLPLLRWLSHSPANVTESHEIRINVKLVVLSSRQTSNIYCVPWKAAPDNAYYPYLILDLVLREFQ